MNKLLRGHINSSDNSLSVQKKSLKFTNIFWQWKTSKHHLARLFNHVIPLILDTALKYNIFVGSEEMISDAALS